MSLGVWGDMIPMQDGGLLLVGPIDGCDVIGGTELLRLDGSGALTWQSTISEYDVYHLTARSPTEHLALIGSYSVMITDLQGGAHESWPAPYWSIGTALWSNSNSFLVTTNNKICRLDLDGNKLDSLEFDDPVNDLRYLGNDLFALTNSSIFQIDEDLSIQAGYPIPAGAFSARDFMLGSEELLIRADSAIVSWDESNGAQILIIPELLPGQKIVSAILNEGVLTTANTVSMNNRTSGLMRAYLLDGTTSEHDENVSISVEVDSAWFEHFPPTGGPGNLYYEKANASITLTNLGSSDLEDVLISHESSPYFWMGCDVPTEELRLSNAHLPNGADTTVVMHDLIIGWRLSNPGESSTREVCIVAQSPNNKVDRYGEDNESCQTVTFTNTVDIGELKTAVLDVFPNPFTDHILLRSSTTGPLNTTLFDATGREVFTSRTTSATGPTRIDLPVLTDGIYFLRTNDGHEQRTERLVKAKN